MVTDKFSRRFTELAEKSRSLEFRTDGLYGRYVPSGVWQEWATSCQSLIKAVFGEDSPQYTNFTEALKDCGGSESEVESLRGIFRSAMEDFEGGYVFNVDLRISGEVFGSFVALAKQSLANPSLTTARPSRFRISSLRRQKCWSGTTNACQPGRWGSQMIVLRTPPGCGSTPSAS